MPEESIVTLKEITKATGVSRVLLGYLVVEYQVPHFKVGKARAFTPSGVDRLKEAIEAHRRKGDSKPGEIERSIRPGPQLAGAGRKGGK